MNKRDEFVIAGICASFMMFPAGLFAESEISLPAEAPASVRAAVDSEVSTIIGRIDFENPSDSPKDFPDDRKKGKKAFEKGRKKKKNSDAPFPEEPPVQPKMTVTLESGEVYEAVIAPPEKQPAHNGAREKPRAEMRPEEFMRGPGRFSEYNGKTVKCTGIFRERDDGSKEFVLFDIDGE